MPEIWSICISPVSSISLLVVLHSDCPSVRVAGSLLNACQVREPYKTCGETVSAIMLSECNQYWMFGCAYASVVKSSVRFQFWLSLCDCFRCHG